MTSRPISYLYRGALAWAVFAFFAGGAHADIHQLALSELRDNELDLANETSAGPEGEWGRQKGILVGTGITAIASIDGGATRTEQLLGLTKNLYEDVVMDAGGQIGQWLAAGTIAGMELDLFPDDDPTDKPGSGEHLGTVGVLIGLDEDDQPIEKGSIYFFDAAQLQARVEAIESDEGALDVDWIYHGPVMQSSARNSFSMHFQTSDSTIHGEMLCEGNWAVSGNRNAVRHLVRWRDAHALNGSDNAVAGYHQEATSQAQPLPPRTANGYETLALANDTFFDSDVVIVLGPSGPETSLGIPLDGVVYSTGDITVQSDDITAALTLVAEGSIELAGDGCTLQAAVDGVLAWSIGDGNGSTPNDVVISGSDNHLTGRMYAHGGRFDVLGDDTTRIGNSIAYRVLVAGERCYFGDGTDQ